MLIRNAALLTLTGALIMGGCGGDTSESNNETPAGPVVCNQNICQVQGDILEDTRFEASNIYVLNGGVFVGDESSATVLTIEPGTTVYGSTGTLSFLAVRRNAQLVADGTAELPIVFTSSKEDGKRARGDWGGLILNGNAPINSCSEGVCEAQGEGGTGAYGGDDPTDNSGTLRYVRVEFAGALITSDNELNGIALQGVGNKTTLDYVQVHMNKDDGIEFFGGTVNAKHVLLTGIGDDGLDWTDGWQGKVQYVIAQQYPDTGDQGIEADNNGDNNTATPRSKPTISNVTLIGVPGAEGSDVGVLLREGTAGVLHNVIVDGFNDGCLQIDGRETFVNAWDDSASMLSEELTMSTSIVNCATPYIENTDDSFEAPFTVEDWFTKLASGNQDVDPMIVDPRPADGAPNFLLQVGSPAIGAGQAPSGAFFEDADFVGGMGDEDWTTGWTTHARK